MRLILLTLLVSVLLGVVRIGRCDAPRAYPSGRCRHRADAAARPAFYVDLLPFGAVLLEDEQNRLTARRTDHLDVGGLILRLGGVIDGHHLLGCRIQGFVRPARNVFDEQGAVTQDCWGLVVNGFVGPEYRFRTSSGF